MSNDKPTPSSDATTQDPHFLNTYSRIALNEWSELANLIRLHSKYIKELPIQESQPQTAPAPAEEDAPIEFDFDNDEIDFGDEFAASFAQELETEKIRESEKLEPLLSISQIEMAMAGPYQHFFKMMFSAYAKIARLRFEKHVKKEDVFKGHRTVLSKELAISDEKIEKVSFSQLNDIQKQFNVKSKEYHQVWQQFYHEWCDKLCETLQQNNIALTEYEIKDVHDEDTLAELLPKFREMHLETPKFAAAITFTQYLSLKLHLTIHSSYSRRHMPHADTDINKTLKQHKSSLSKMSKQEAKLLKQQQKEIKELLAQVGW